MRRILIINGHQAFASSPGALNAFYAGRAEAGFEAAGAQVRRVATAGEWEVEAEVENQRWADLIFLQFPLNSMGPPWPLKRYLDEVYTAGMDGRLARGDGRTRSDPARQYGSGGLMQDTAYAFSVTMNAPRAAFNDSAMELFAGLSPDELLAPLHINFAFFGMQRRESLFAHDVNKNPDHAGDVQRFDAFLGRLIAV